jgi:hypothetical protein
MHHEGVRMVFVDTACSNTGAIKFFNLMGYGKPEAEVWMSKLIQRTRKGRAIARPAGTRLRKWHEDIAPGIARHTPPQRRSSS